MTAPSTGRPAARRLSLWAVGALVCSILGFLPLIGALPALLGFLLAIAAFFDLKRRPHQKGKSLAVAALGIGVTFLAIWLALARWWHVQVRLPILNGPYPELSAGQSGRIAEFHERFVDYPTENKHLDAVEFLSELTMRYGTIVSTEPWDTGERIRLEDLDRMKQRIPCTFTFSSGSFEAEAVFVTRSEERFLPLVARWQSITIFDASRGDLSYPPDTRGQGRDESE